MNTMLLRRLYSGASFDSPIFKALGPLLNASDRIAQSVLGTNSKAPLPPFTLRARSSGILNQFGGTRYVQHSDNFIDFLKDSGVLGSDRKVTVFEIGSGVGRIPRALMLSNVDYVYTGVDIDPPSVSYCENNFSDIHRFHLLDVSNGAYRADGSQDPTSISFDMVKDESIDLITSWSVFTHMEFEHICHYLVQIRNKLKIDGTAVLSAFVYDDRKWMIENMKYAYKEGYTVNLENPMKAIAFSEEKYVKAFDDAGLELVEPFIPKRDLGSVENHPRAQGQDVFLVRRKKTS